MSKKLILQIAETQHGELGLLAKERGQSVAAIVRDAIREYLVMARMVFVPTPRAADLRGTIPQPAAPVYGTVPGSPRGYTEPEPQ